MRSRIYIWALSVLLFYQEARVFAELSPPLPLPSNPVSTVTPADPNVNLANYYPIISEPAGSTRIITFLMLLPNIAPTALSAHFFNCNLACCTNAKNKGKKAYDLFLKENPSSIINAFVGHENDFHVDMTISLTGLPMPIITYKAGTGTHTGANCFFFCNRFTISPDGVHNIGFMHKFMRNFMPSDPAQIGSPEHRKTIRLLAATLSVQSILSSHQNPKNTILHRYLMTSNSVINTVKEVIGSPFAGFKTQAQITNEPIVMEELRRYHCKVTLTPNDPDYASIGCGSL